MTEGRNRTAHSGEAKLTFLERLGESWSGLAAVLEIPAPAERRFAPGREAEGIWRWLEDRGGLDRLPGALDRIERSDLAAPMRLDRSEPRADSRKGMAPANERDRVRGLDRRHLLIVATQCRSMPELADLGAGAQELQAALLDPGAGACEPGLPDGTSLRHGQLTAGEVTDAVLLAAQYAAERGATLVLALLGHGFVSGRSTRLFFMGHDSKDQARDEAVDVSDLLIRIVDDVRITGLVAVVDACVAADAAPDMGELLNGTRDRRGRIAVLLAAGAAQPTYGLRVSRGLAVVLSRGIPEAGARLDVDSVRSSLRQYVHGRTITPVEHDEVIGSNLWLGFNRLHLASSESLGVRGLGQLDRALAAAGWPRRQQSDVGVADLAALAQESAGADSPPLVFAHRALVTLLVAVKSVAFARSTLRRSLRSVALEQALARLDAVGAPASVIADQYELSTEVDFIEYVALRRTGVDWPAPRSLAYFMVALAEAQGLNPDTHEFHDWALAVGASLYLNDAMDCIRALATAEKVRLVVSLHASLTGDRWPESVETWLLDRSANPGRMQLRCLPTQAGVEAALAEAVEWAEDEALRRGVCLRHIDVAVPAGLMLSWRPEEAIYGERLGLNYQVLVHWSKRLTPSRGEGWIVSGVRRRLAESGPPRELAWLLEGLSADLAELVRQLRNGRQPHAVGLTQPPATVDLLEALLPHVPILLWPWPAGGCSSETQEAVNNCWPRMPRALLEAYRRRWRHDDPNPMADLRAAWDDVDWLMFCSSYQRARPRSYG